MANLKGSPAQRHEAGGPRPVLIAAAIALVTATVAVGLTISRSDDVPRQVAPCKWFDASLELAPIFQATVVGGGGATGNPGYCRYELSTGTTVEVRARRAGVADDRLGDSVLEVVKGGIVAEVIISGPRASPHHIAAINELLNKRMPENETSTDR